MTGINVSSIGEGKLLRRRLDGGGDDTHQVDAACRATRGARSDSFLNDGDASTEELAKSRMSVERRGMSIAGERGVERSTTMARGERGVETDPLDDIAS